MSKSLGRRPRYMEEAADRQLGRRHKPDYWLVILACVLLAIGVIVVYAIGPALQATTGQSASYYTTRQMIAIGLSIVAFFVAASIPLKLWKRYYKVLIVISLMATALAVVLPVNPSYPAHRWVRLGGLSFQSVELVKFSIVIATAVFLADGVKRRVIGDIRKTLLPILVALGVVLVVVAGIQSDLGSMGVIVAIMGVMAFIAGLPLKKIAVVVAVIVIGLIIAISAFPYRRERLYAYIHPSSNCQTASGYQACQALIAVGSGGFTGLGLGRSIQAYGYEPEADNDSIFAIYAETFGFIGSVVLLAIFAALFSRLKTIAERLDDDFSRLVVVGVLTWLSVQTIINIGAMVGLLPLKGITLPFISYGGTSIVFVAAAIGVVFQISRYTTYRKINVDKGEDRRQTGEDSVNRRRLGGAYHPDPGSRG